MNFRIILFILLIWANSPSFAQDNQPNEGKAGNDISSDGWDDEHYGIIGISFYQPMPFGDNFSKMGLDHSFGSDLSLRMNLGSSKGLLGLRYARSEAKVKNGELVGNYRSSRISLFSLEFGYHLLRTKDWQVIVMLGVGNSTYKNEGNNSMFRDTGPSYYLIPSVGYHFGHHLGAYFNLNIRHDRVDIEAPEPYTNFFKSGNYIMPGISINLVF